MTQSLGEKLAPVIPEILKDRYEYHPAHLERFLTRLDLKVAPLFGEEAEKHGR